MSRWPAPTRADHASFCQGENWRLVRDARGRTGTHHITYELDLPDGRTLRTRVSHPPDRTAYGRQLWRHILRDQLQVTEREFWACVRGGVTPTRAIPTQSTEALPADLVRLLVSRVGLTEDQVALMTEAQAIERLEQYWAQRHRHS